MKKLILTVLALFLTTLIIFSAQTVAYFTDHVEANPVISISGSNLSGELIETTGATDGAKAYVGSAPLKILPGKTVMKSVAVKNTGGMEMYLRLKVDKFFELSPENAGKAVDPSLVEFEIDGEYWEERDGFYYYKTPLLSGQVTAPLFTEIKFSESMDNTYTNSNITFHIRAYATQVSENGANVFEAQGWPAALEMGGSA